MYEGDNLIVKDFIAMINAAISKMTSDITDLQNAQRAFKNFSTNSDSVSPAIQTLQKIADDYITLINGCISANDDDIADCRTLLGEIGSTDYIGKDIVPGMNNAKSKADRNYELYNEKWNEYLNLDRWRVFEIDYAIKAAMYYKVCGDLNMKEYNKWKAKAEKFDEINTATYNLFSNSKSFRAEAGFGLKAMDVAISVDGVTENYQDFWTVEIREEQQQNMNDLIESYYMEDGDVRELNWDRIDEFLRANPDDLREADYLAMAAIINEMSTVELQKLLNRATWEDEKYSSPYYFYYERSKTLETAISYYYFMAENIAATTYFNEDSLSLSVEENAYYTNLLTKATMLKIAIGRIAQGSLGDDMIVDILEIAVDDYGLVSYEVQVTPSNFSQTQDSDVWEYTKEQRMFTIYPCTGGSGLDRYGDEIVVDTLMGLDKSLLQFSAEEGAKIVIEKLVGGAFKLIGGTVGEVGGAVFAVAAGAFDLMKDGIETEINHININGTIELVELVNYMSSLGMYASIVNADGIFTNETQFASVKYDPTDLQMRLYLYNQDQNNPDKLHNLQDVLDAFDGGDTAVLSDFDEWYTSNATKGEAKVAAFRATFNQYWDDYCEENNLNPDTALYEMSEEQLQEVFEYVEARADEE